VYGFIPGLAIDPSVTANAAEASISLRAADILFSEPAHFAIFILPVYAINAFQTPVFPQRRLLGRAHPVHQLDRHDGGDRRLRAYYRPGTENTASHQVGPCARRARAALQFLPELSESGIFEKFKFVNLEDKHPRFRDARVF
jgi:hypothetical protein